MPSLPSLPPVVDLNSYHKKYSMNDPDVLPLLQPMDKSLRPRFDEAVATHTPGDPLPAIKALLQAYGLYPLAAAGAWVPDVQTYRDLIDDLLAVRAGTSTLPMLSADVQRQLYMLAGIPVKDLELDTLTKCAKVFNERFGGSFDEVAISSEKPNPDKGDLKAQLGIMG